MPTSARNGKSDKGQQTARNILEAAEQLLIDQGYHNFSLRKVTASAGLTIGNLQYYFPTKDSLISAMLDQTIQRYLTWSEEIRMQAGPDPEKQFVALVSQIIRDLNKRSTTMFFPELWALANHNDHATGFMDEMYDKYRQVLVEVMHEVNPELCDAQLQRLALYISCSIEGHTVFIGHEKPWIAETENIAIMASESFLWLIHSGKVPGYPE